MAFIEIQNVSFSYPNANEAVKGITLSIEKGERVAIIGQNGAGKTTLVKLINGLLKPTSGDVAIGGKNTKDFTAAQISKSVGYSFQNPDDQIFNKDVYNEIAYGLKKMKLNSEEIKKRVLKAAKLCQIDKQLYDNPYDLSLSIRRFVAIASIIAMDTDVVILDEPTAGQDKRGLTCLSNIIDVLSKQDKTVITITHDMEFVANNFDRAVVMAEKQKIADESTKMIFSNKELLDKAKLKEPYLIRLSEELNLKGEFIKINDFICYMENMRVFER